MAGLASNLANVPPASYVFGGGQVFGPGQTPLAEGSTAGVPAPANATGQVEDTGQQAVKSSLAFGLWKAGQPVTQQPVFWLVVVLMISVVMLSHVTHVALK